MRKLLVSLLLAFVIPAAAQDENNGLYTLKSGNVTMTIDAAKGGKILSFKYGDQEVISQLKWPESFGSTFWTSPQKEWYWPPVPEYDKKPYAVEEKDGVLTMTSEVNDKLKYRIRVDSIWPAGLMNFKDANGIACYEPDEANDNRKVNADGKGWLAYLNKEKGLLLVKQFEDLAKGQPAPDEAEIQVYVNRGKTYIELESQGAYTTLKPKEQVCWTVRWNLLPCEGTPTLSDALLQKIRNLKSSN